MSNVKVERDHALGAEIAATRIKQIEPKLKERYGVTLDWKGTSADIKGKGVSGTVTVEDARVALDLKLGLMLKPLAGKIREGIEKQVDQALA